MEAGLQKLTQVGSELADRIDLCHLSDPAAPTRLGGIWAHAFPKYSPLRVSTFTLSPVLMNSGT